MTRKQTTRIGRLIRTAREAKGISTKELARRSGLIDTTIGRIERGETAMPSQDALIDLANALDLDLADLYVAARYMHPGTLPTFAPYLRSKYGDLPPSARRELEASFQRIAAKHGYDSNGPRPGEDERE